MLEKIVVSLISISIQTYCLLVPSATNLVNIFSNPENDNKLITGFIKRCSLPKISLDNI